MNRAFSGQPPSKPDVPAFRASGFPAIYAACATGFAWIQSWQTAQTMSVLRRFFAMRAAHAGWPGPGFPSALRPAEPCYQVRLALAMLPGLEAGPQPVPGLDLGLVTDRHLGDGAAVLGGQGLQHGRHGVPVQGVQPPDVPGEQVIVHHAPVLGSVDPHDVVVVEVLEPGPVPRFAVFPVAGALGPDHVRRYPQRDLPVDSPLALGDLRVAVLDLDVVAEKPRRLAASVGDQGFLLVQFQPEGLPEERGQPGLDLLGFGLRPDKSQYV